MHPHFYPAVASMEWPPPPDGEPSTLRQKLAEYERALIIAALIASRGHQRRAAEALGLLPSTLLEKMRRLDIPTARQIAALRPARDETPRLAAPRRRA